MATGAKRHTHKYHRVDGIWYCSLPDCTHYMPRNIKTGILNKACVCWSCENEFIATPESIKDNQPVCDNCREKRQGIAAFLAEKGML